MAIALKSRTQRFASTASMRQSLINPVWTEAARHTHAGVLAQRHLEKVTKGNVRCESVETDRYGREVSICFAGDTDLGAAMVSAGWARAYLSYSLRYASEEQAARNARRGLWDGDFDDPWVFREDGVKDDLIAWIWRWLMENWRWVFEQIF